MTKIQEYFNNLAVGEVVNKRGLAYLKRKGLIWDYSPWGYLEGVRIVCDNGKPQSDGIVDTYYTHLFPKGNANEVRKIEPHKSWSDDRQTDKTWSEALGAYGNEWNGIECGGVTFVRKFFDGCFSPYLVKSGPANGREVHHRMSLYGAII